MASRRGAYRVVAVVLVVAVVMSLVFRPSQSRVPAEWAAAFVVGLVAAVTFIVVGLRVGGRFLGHDRGADPGDAA